VGLDTKVTNSSSSRSRERRWTFSLALILWATVLAAGSWQPLRPEGFHTGLAHRSIHIFCFGILALLADLVMSLRGRWIYNALGCLLLGVGLEVLQYFTYRISFEWSDIWNDGIGIGLGLALGLALRRVST
jgi:hypothetical protein